MLTSTLVLLVSAVAVAAVSVGRWKAPRAPVKFDLNAGRDPSIKTWCKVVMMPNHRGWSAREPPEEDTNLTVSIFPFVATAFQLTCAKDTSHARAAARVVDAWSWITDDMFQFVAIRLYWWGDVFPMFLGMKDAILVNISHAAPHASGFYCDVQSVDYGTRIGTK